MLNLILASNSDDATRLVDNVAAIAATMATLKAQVRTLQDLAATSTKTRQLEKFASDRYGSLVLWQGFLEFAAKDSGFLVEEN